MIPTEIFNWAYTESLYTARPLNSANQRDWEELFGSKGACAGCWCTFYRLPRKVYRLGKGEGNRKKMSELIKHSFTGVLLYHGSEAVAWMAMGRRKDFPALDRSRFFKRVDEEEVWSLPCFFVAQAYRGKGLNSVLLRAAKDLVQKQGGGILEAYPLPEKEKAVDAFSWNGFRSTFERAGFTVAVARSKDRPVMRLKV